jgi:hypothetical protein
MREVCEGRVSGTGETAPRNRMPSRASASIPGVAFYPEIQPRASGRNVSIVMRRMSGRADGSGEGEGRAESEARSRIAVAKPSAKTMRRVARGAPPRRRRERIKSQA